MVENRPWLTIFAHAVLIAGIALVAFPLYVTFVASTHTLEEIIHVPMPLLPGSPAINAGSNTENLAYDERGPGFIRVAGSAPDVGAFENGPVPIAFGSAPSPVLGGTL